MSLDDDIDKYLGDIRLQGFDGLPAKATASAADLAKFEVHLQNILRGKAGLVPQPLVQEMTRPQHDDFLDLENTACKTGLGCYLKYIHGEAYFGHSGGNYGFESRINFSVQNGNGCCVLINSATAGPLIGKLQDFFLDLV